MVVGAYYAPVRIYIIYGKNIENNIQVCINVKDSWNDVLFITKLLHSFIIGKIAPEAATDDR